MQWFVCKHWLLFPVEERSTCKSRLLKLYIIFYRLLCNVCNWEITFSMFFLEKEMFTFFGKKTPLPRCPSFALALESSWQHSICLKCGHATRFVRIRRFVHMHLKFCKGATELLRVVLHICTNRKVFRSQKFGIFDLNLIYCV